MKYLRLLLAAVLITALVFLIAAGFTTETYTDNWTEIRDEVTSGAGEPNEVERLWADKPSHAVDLGLARGTSKYNAAVLRFRFNDPGAAVADGNSVNYYVYGYGRRDDASKIAEGTATCGKQTATMGGNYGNAITITNKHFVDWATSPSDPCGIAKISGDLTGIRWLAVFLDSITECGGSAGKVSVDIRGY